MGIIGRPAIGLAVEPSERAALGSIAASAAIGPIGRCAWGVVGVGEEQGERRGDVAARFAAAPTRAAQSRRPASAGLATVRLREGC